MIPSDYTLEEWVAHLKEQLSASMAFSSLMDYPKGIREERISNLTLDGRPVRVVPYATQEDCDILTDALVRYEPAYRPDITRMARLKEMSKINRFFNCPKHCV